MKRFAQGFAAAYLLAAGYFGFFLWVAEAVQPKGAEIALAIVWPATMAPLFWRTETWTRNRKTGGQHADR